MSVFLRSLSVLEENVRAEVKRIRSYPVSRGEVLDACARLIDQLAADVREVRADVGALMERNGEGW